MYGYKSINSYSGAKIQEFAQTTDFTSHFQVERFHKYYHQRIFLFQ